MKRWMILVFALMLVLAMALSFAAAETVQPEKEKSILTYEEADFDYFFNAFFAENPDDQVLVDLVAAPLLGTTPNGDFILDGEAGFTTSYRGMETTHYGVSSVQVVENADGTVDYQIALRPDVYFSDGHQANIDDVLFSLYVLCDPSYDGPVKLHHLPVQGLKPYTGATAPLSELLLEAGRENVDFALWDKTTQTAFWTDLDAAGTALAQDVVDYILENFLDENYAAEIGRTVEEIAADPQLQLQLGMTVWGYGAAYTEGMTAADYWQVMLDEYDGDVMLAAATETVGPSIYDYIEGYEEKYGGIVQAADGPVNTVTGFIRTGDYSMILRAEQENEAILYALASVPVMPLHYYGNEDTYNYEAQTFGFEKGDLSSIHAKDDDPLGCGMYAFAGIEDGTAVLEPNPYYFAGEAAYEKVLLQETPGFN